MAGRGAQRQQMARATDDKGMADARQQLVDLMLAAKGGDKRKLRKTVRRLAKKNDEKDGSALHEASVLSSYADGAGRTAIHFAANFGVLPCCEYIVETAPDSVNWTDQEGSTGLIMAALGGHVKVVKYLIASGSLVNATRQTGDSALHLAATHNHLDVLTTLLEEGAEVNAVGASGTPLWLAAREGNAECAAALVKGGATVDAYNEMKVTPLIVAATANHHEVVKVLLGAGAAVDFVAGESGITALHMAAEHGNKAMVEMLLAADAGPSCATVAERHGLKPVELAAGGSHREIVELLLPLSQVEGSVDELIAAQSEIRRKEQEEHEKGKAATTTVQPEDAARAAELKIDGNRAFVAKDFATALDIYTKAIAHDPTNHALWSNRAACNLELGNAEAALADADECIKCKPDWAKGYFRKGRAHEAAEQFEDASLAYWEAAKRDASVAVFRESFQRALKLAKEQYAKQNAAASAGAGSSEAKA